MKILAAILILAGLAALYGVAYYLNHKTPVPEGCENLKQSCQGCKDFSCGNNPAHDIKED